MVNGCVTHKSRAFFWVPGATGDLKMENRVQCVIVQDAFYRFRLNMDVKIENKNDYSFIDNCLRSHGSHSLMRVKLKHFPAFFRPNLVLFQVK